MSSKNIKKRVNILMCATLLSTSALPVTPVFADDVSSVIEKTTSDKPANGVSDQAQQNESAISSTKIEETTMSSTATVSKENSHLEVQKKSSSSESSAPATSVIATDKAVQPTNIITDMWGTAPVSYNEVNGELTVSSGTIDNRNADNIGNSSIKNQDVTKIIISGDVKLPSDSTNLFGGYSFPNLVVIEGSFDTSNVTDMDSMFAQSKLTSLDVSQWNTSNVKNMGSMFSYSKLTSLDVSQWNTSNVTDMRSMFEHSELTSLDVSQWNTSNVTNMSSMFFNSKLTSLDVSQWNTSNVKNMRSMFAQSKLTSLDVSQWNTSNVTDMSGMFYYSKLTSLDVSQWNTSNVTNMDSMFAQSKLTSLDVSQWNTSNVKNMRFMFDHSELTSLDVSQWNTSNVTNMTGMFRGSELTELDLTNWDTSKVQNSSIMFLFSGIKKLTLGSKTKFNNDPHLPDINRSSGVYTGRWERIDPVSPQSFYNGSNDFMSNYDGSFPGTYVWEKIKVKAADVTAKYLDENGNTISDDVVKNGNVGDSYTTEQKAIPGYTFKAVQGNPTGQFTSDAQTVTYIYTKDPVAGGNVTVKYVDGAGNTISDNVVKSGNIGDSYTTEQKAIPGYTFKEIQGSASGQFTDKEQTVTYVYTKDPVVGGSVLVKYVDEAGNTLSDNVVKNGNVGDSYTTEQKAIPGYTFKAVQGNPTGQFTSDAQTVTYIYTKDPVAGGNVTVKYVDGAGNTISDNVVKSGNIGDDYSTDQKAIPGYTFKEVQGSASGQFTDQEQTVTYVYTKDPVAGGNVTVKYVDGAGNTISDNVVKSGNIGDDYSTEQKAIPGYTFKEVQGSASGQFTDKEQTITYVYTKNSVTPVKPTEPGTTQTNENNTETPVKNTTNVSLHNNVSTLGSVSTTNEKSLPTTGEKPANWSVVVGGLITLTAATVLYLLKRKY